MRSIRRRTTSRSLVVLVTSVLALVASSTPASAHAKNSLHDNWEGAPQSTWDSTFVPPADSTIGHSESSAVFYNGQWLMYHRVCRNCGTGSEGADLGYSTSPDGTNWTYQGIFLNASAIGMRDVYAPKVLVQAGKLTMVFEANPDGVVDCGGTPKQRVWLTTSTTGTYIDYLSPRELIIATQSWEGNLNGFFGCYHHGNVGTPTITWRPGDGYYVTYHGFDGGAQLRRGYYYWPESVGVGNQQSYNFTRRSGASPMEFRFQNNTGNVYIQYPNDVGVGAADIIYWQSGSGGTDDGGYYMVLERFRGSPLCNSDSTNWNVMARAATPQGPWLVQNTPLLEPKKDFGGNVIPGCGQDMPSWQFHSGQYKVILTKWNPNNGHWGIQRLKLCNAYLGLC